MLGTSGDLPRKGVSQVDEEDDVTQRSGDNWRGVTPGEDEADDVMKQFLGDTSRGGGIPQVEYDEDATRWCSGDLPRGVVPGELEDEEAVTQR